MISVGAAAFFYGDLQSKSPLTQKKSVTPVIEAATPPVEIAPTQPDQPTSADSATSNEIQAVRDGSVMGGSVPVQTQSPLEIPIDKMPVAKSVPLDSQIPSNITTKPAEDQQSSARLDKQEQKINELSAIVEALSKKVEAISTVKAETPKQILRTASPGKDEVNRSMKDLKITALLSDGLIFEGDVAVQIGQYSKTLKGKILSINPDTNTIITDNRIYKVQ